MDHQDWEEFAKQEIAIIAKAIEQGAVADTQDAVETDRLLSRTLIDT